MRVRTIRDHSNRYPPVYEKRSGRIYEVSDSEGLSLIQLGYVESADAKDSNGKPGGQAVKD